MKFSDQELIEDVPKRNLRAVARLISLVEERSPRSRGIQSKLFAKTGKAHVIGITGSPGAGKSTLVDQLARAWKKAGKSVAILAVDPSSPFSGGAILGDRIRMAKTAEDAGIYIRSMATRGALGGLSRATFEAVQVLDSAGFDLVLVETVGVGQAEVDIVRAADTCLVVLVPGMGDSVQSIKAGILEIADLFIINKADREGADLLQKDLRVLLSLAEYSKEAWKPEILQTVATSGDGIDEVLEQVGKHRAWFKSSKLAESRKRTLIEETIRKLVSEITEERIITAKNDELQKLVNDCSNRITDPFSAAEKLLS